jgi:hypothetical protein
MLTYLPFMIIFSFRSTLQNLHICTIPLHNLTFHYLHVLAMLFKWLSCPRVCLALVRQRRRMLHNAHAHLLLLRNPSYWLNAVALVRKRTTPTERPPHVGEFSANFCGQRVLRGQRNGYLRPLISIFYTRSRYFSIQVAPQLSSRG